MSLELYPAEHPKDMTLNLLSKRSQKPKFQYLVVGSGQIQEWLEAIALISLGECLMPSTGESPNVDVESSLLHVLQKNAPAKYYLSKKACEGIVRRANKRGKILPPLLEKALQYRIKNTDDALGVAYTNNETKVYALCSKSSNSMKSSNPHSGIYEATTTRTLDCNGGNPSCNQGGMILVEGAVKAIHESISGDSVYISDTAYALRSGRKPLLMESFQTEAPYPKLCNDNNLHISMLHPDIVATLTASAGGISRPGGSQGNETDYYIACFLQNSETHRPTIQPFTPKGFAGYQEGIGTLKSSGGDCGGGSESIVTHSPSNINGAEDELINSPLYIVRRLTPIECERLQGFPDDWTKYGIASDKPIADTPRYQMLGNSICINCVQFIMKNIKLLESKPAQKEDS